MFTDFKFKSEEELASLTPSEKSDYLLKKGAFEWQVKSYNKIVEEYKKNPGKWYYAVLNFTTENYSVFYVDGAQILFPQPVATNLERQYIHKAGFGSHLKWKVQLCMQSGELQIFRANPLTFLNCRWLAGAWDNLRANNEAIAAHAKNGYYLLHITNIDKNVVSKNGNPMVRVSYEVLSGEARGFSGICCFIKNQTLAVKNFENLQKCCDTEDLVTAHIDFTSKFVTVSNFRKPTGDEKGAWV